MITWSARTAGAALACAAVLLSLIAVLGPLLVVTLMLTAVTALCMLIARTARETGFRMVPAQSSQAPPG